MFGKKKRCRGQVPNLVLGVRVDCPPSSEQKRQSPLATELCLLQPQGHAGS